MTTGIQSDPAPPYRLTFLTTGLMTGGAEMMLLKLCSRLDRHRFAPSVVSLSAAGALQSRLRSLGVPVYSAGMRRGWPSLSGLLRLRAVMATLQPDVIQGWMYHGNLAAMLLGHNRPVVMGIRQSLYGLDKERALTRGVIRFGAWLSRYASSVVYNSQTSARQHEAFGFAVSRTRIIPNGFDTNLFCPDPSAASRIKHELGLSDDVILIGLIGRYHPMKDHRTFLSAAALLSQRFPAARFLLAGTGVDAGNTELATLIGTLGLSRRILLLGERNDMPQINAALDIASSTSAWGEGFANVVGEAMSCGVPCVVTDIGDSAWVVGDAGQVVPAGDPQAMAEAWESLIELGGSGREALGRRARQRIVECFSLESVVKRYEKLYENVIMRREVSTCAE